MLRKCLVSKLFLAAVGIAVCVGCPGAGRDVKKSQTRLDLAAAETVLGPADVARIREVLGGRLDARGMLCVSASEYRSQVQNYEAAMARMGSLLGAALTRRARRIATKPSRGSKRRRVDEKRHRGEIKRGRQGGPPAD